MKLFYQISSIILVILFTSLKSESQEFEHVLGNPEKFSSIVDKEGQEYDDFVNKPTGPKHKTKPWIVINDREGQETYTEPGSSSKTNKKLMFREWFYVAAEKGEYIRIIKMNGSPESNLSIIKGSFIEDYGWVEKSKLLLWTSGLRSPRTGIYLKSLILYTVEAADKILKNNKELVKLRVAPRKDAKPLADISLYDFYFILKKENGMYLLGRQSNMLLQGDYKSEILGWVEQNDQADWNTRLALEPNFSKEAYDERKLRPSCQFVSYKDEDNAIRQFLTGSGDKQSIISIDDPVNADEKMLARSNNKRFIGTKLRMPVLGSFDNYFYTGVLGSLGKDRKQNDCPICQQIYSEMSSFNNNYDILFLIEATTAMRTFKEDIKNAIAGLKRELTDVPNKRFAVAFYRDVKFGKEKTFLDIIPFTTEIDKITNKIDEVTFSNDNYDPNSSMYYALNKSLSKAGFMSERTNIVYVIGQNPDFRSEPGLKAKAVDEGNDAYIRTDKVVDQMSELGVHLIFIEAAKSSGTEMTEFKEQCEELMLEVSKGNFRKYKKVNDLLAEKSNIKDSNPLFSEDEGIVRIEGGNTKAVFYSSISNSHISQAEFTNFIRSPFKDIKAKQNRVSSALEALMDGGSSLDEVGDEIVGGGFELGALKEKLSRILQKSGLDLTEENLKLLTDRKVKLYVKAFVPKRISGANFDLCSPVLFFPEAELGDYLSDLRAITALQGETDDVLRQRLKEALLSLYNKYAGNKKAMKDADMNDLRTMLVGEGFKFDNQTHNFVLNRIDNPRVKIETLRGFLDELTKKHRKLENMTKDNSYEFKFRTKSGSIGRNIYYWIPFEDTF